MKKYLAVLMFVFLSACATSPQNPGQVVYQANQAYVAAATVALAYKQLPPCPQVTHLCSDAATVEKIKVADATAYSLLVKAENAARGGGSNVDMAVSIALEAIKSLTILTNSLQVK